MKAGRAGGDDSRSRPSTTQGLAVNTSNYAYDDEQVRLAVEVTELGGIRIEAAGTGVGAAVNLTVTGAQRLSGLLASAITTAIRRGLGGGGR
jgi:hypothetical protein